MAFLAFHAFSLHDLDAALTPSSKMAEQEKVMAALQLVSEPDEATDGNEGIVIVDEMMTVPGDPFPLENVDGQDRAGDVNENVVNVDDIATAAPEASSHLLDEPGAVNKEPDASDKHSEAEIPQTIDVDQVVKVAETDAVAPATIDLGQDAALSVNSEFSDRMDVPFEEDVQEKPQGTPDAVEARSAEVAAADARTADAVAAAVAQEAKATAASGAAVNTGTGMPALRSMPALRPKPALRSMPALRSKPQVPVQAAEKMQVDTEPPQFTKGLVQVPDERLIGFGGKMMLKESGKPVIQGRADIFEYIAQFKAKHSLNSKPIQSILSLLKMGGMTRERICRETLNYLVDQLKTKILHMNQQQLTLLLSKSYGSLTVPEMRPVATLVLEKLDDVDVATWQEIVNNGLEASPYTDLPSGLKRRIWIAVPAAFQFELNKLIKEIRDYVEPETIHDIVALEDRPKMRATNKTLQKFMRLLGTSDNLHVMMIDRMVEVASIAETTSRRKAFANMFHDMLCLASRRQMPNLEKLRRMAIFLDAGGSQQDMELAQVREIREGLSESASCGPVALLVSSTYTGDFVISQLVRSLIGQKKLLPKSPGAAEFQKRAQELLRDPFLKDLTYICLSNMRAKELLAENIPLPDTDASGFYAHFFPLLCNEIAVDDWLMLDNFFRANALEPHSSLLQAAGKDAFERRVLIHYALVLLNRNNIVSVAKLRLVLDFALQRCDGEEEAKEAAIARGLIMHVMDS